MSVAKFFGLSLKGRMVIKKFWEKIPRGKTVKPDLSIETTFGP
jgi:hypothetical protein